MLFVSRCLLCHCHAPAMMPCNSGYRGSQPNSCLIFSLSAMRMSGSPGRRGSNSAGMNSRSQTQIIQARSKARFGRLIKSTGMGVFWKGRCSHLVPTSSRVIWLHVLLVLFTIHARRSLLALGLHLTCRWKWITTLSSSSARPLHQSAVRHRSGAVQLDARQRAASGSHPSHHDSQ